MGTVVEAIFDRTARAPAAGESRQEGGAEAAKCEIVIFPGVRIERHAGPPPRLRPPRKPTRSRRRRRADQIA